MYCLLRKKESQHTFCQPLSASCAQLSQSLGSLSISSLYQPLRHRFMAACPVCGRIAMRALCQGQSSARAPRAPRVRRACAACLEAHARLFVYTCQRVGSTAGGTRLHIRGSGFSANTGGTGVALSALSALSALPLCFLAGLLCAAASVGLAQDARA